MIHNNGTMTSQVFSLPVKVGVFTASSNSNARWIKRKYDFSSCQLIKTSSIK